MRGWRLAIVLVAVLVAGCATIPDPRHVEAEYYTLTCQQNLAARWQRISERMEVEGRYYGGPGVAEWIGWGSAVFAAAFAEPSSTGLVLGAARMRQAQVKAKLDALNVHIDVLEALYAAHCR